MNDHRFRFSKLVWAFILSHFALFAMSLNSYADQVSINPRPRMESMGGAGVAARGNEDSAMMNPAGLADVEKARIDAFPILGEVPFDLGLINSFTDYDDGSIELIFDDGR